LFQAVHRWKALRDERAERAKAANSEPKANNSYNPSPKVLFMGSGEGVRERAAVADPASPLESALAALGKAIFRT
jgi:hypothetical protein